MGTFNADQVRLREYAHDSERVFAEYLDLHAMKYEREVVVSPGNVDFAVTGRTAQVVLCDVKAVVQPPEIHGRVEAQEQIRADIRGLRKKFEKAPLLPCVLVTMNYSPQLFTGLTIRRAMFGELVVDLSDEGSGPIRHAGNAALTHSQNTSISGLLMIDCAHRSDYLFHNPYARIPVDREFFPAVTSVQLRRDGSFDLDADPMFFPRSASARPR